MSSSLHVHNKARLWFVPMKRHTSSTEKLAFREIGSPLTLAVMLAREIRRGNARTLPEWVQGALDNLPSGRSRSSDSQQEPDAHVRESFAA